MPTPPGNLSFTWKHIGLRDHGMLIFVVLGLLMMCALAIQQDRTIASQRELIHSLYRDSLELNAMKMQQVKAARRP